MTHFADGSERTVRQVVEEQSRRALELYAIDPGLLQEHANGERRINQGGYGERQIYELVQNGADEMRDSDNGEIHVLLTDRFLYCANTGRPMTRAGAETILRMGVSSKRGGQIGRFGVGVKSVLSVSDAPEFFSATGSFGFDKEWAERMVRAVVPDAAEVPVLRMGRPLEPVAAVAADPLLGELLAWAVTVVRLPLLPGTAPRLSNDLRNFPAEFQLFSPHVGSIYLEDRTGVRDFRRELYVRSERNLYTLQTVGGGGKDVTSRWRVFRRTYHPSLKALASAGELHDRPSIDIAWAVQERNWSDRGTFWAYFPTNYSTTLRGLLNAPWKTSEDRQNLFDHNGFNDELIEQSARLVVDSLPDLVDPRDPGSYLAVLPGRGREAPQWADARLTTAVWATAAYLPSLPDQEGVLRKPEELHLPPENIGEQWMKIWAACPDRPVDWTHSSVENRERRARARQIFENAGRKESTLGEWLEALVREGGADASASAVKILAGLTAAHHAEAVEARSAKILLTESDGLVPLDRAAVYQRSGSDELADDLIYVDPRVTDVIGLRSDLNALGVREATPVGKLTAVLDRGFASYNNEDWQNFWALARRVQPREAASTIREAVPEWRRVLRVRTIDGRYRAPADCLLPGRVVPADGLRDPHAGVDLRAHTADRPTLEALGMSDVPVADIDPRTDAWFQDYRSAMLTALSAATSAGKPQPRLNSLELDGTNPPGPLGLLPTLSAEGTALFVEHLPPSRLVQDWTARIGRMTATVRSPMVWMIRHSAKLRTSQGLVPVSMAVNPTMREYGEIFPVARIDRSIADALGLAATIDNVSNKLWAHVVRMVEATEDDTVPGKVYALVLRAGTQWPGGETRCRVGESWGTRPDDQICVTASREEYDALVLENVPALLAPTQADAEAMISAWGMQRYATMIMTEVRSAEETDPVMIVTEYPHLRVLRGRLADGWSFVLCGELDEVRRTPNGMRINPLASASHDRTVYVRYPADAKAILEAISRELDMSLSGEDIRKVIERGEEAKNQDALKKVRAERNLAEKLLLLVGPERLRRGLPEGLIAWEQERTGATVADRRVAELAMHAHGEEILRHHRDDLKRVHETLGVTFTGDRKSQTVVSDLGFPVAFAGMQEERPAETEHVKGPTPHFPLHDYQERMALMMQFELMQERPGRAMLSLPTGAGKTRIAAEAVIQYLKRFGGQGPGRPILWIAQSNELCEQAVQSWKYVWEKAGLGNTRLTISRFWQAREAVAVSGNPHLVVATDDKLTANLGKDAYAWLRDPALVIVDEAHGSITSGYTKILEQLGLTQYRTERPLIGLTATPFRGKNSTETKRLVDRYGGKRLDDGVLGEDPYRTLQDMGVLARVDHRELPGSRFMLTDDEAVQMSQMGRGTLPAAAERRLAEDQARNNTLVEALLSLDRDWPVLVFATSVNHARFLAAVLGDHGIKAAAVDSDTPTPRRQRIIEQFGTGRIRVLTNYGVLHQGFDAPATRAVVVARPTYSPNVYQQMIGRGLRGVTNGGTERCLILNVADNITNHREKLAFTEFEEMWRRS
ncbi:DEAD/DEAH box helicase [Paractinoplanes maris]|uniref:DEAD/DEAH box helicase n=1 Tax=Paractinoplanes maris TaxID=1734446 RepID=UPI00202169CB|nr:DEAD/DEAH box helicase [Actinoplanes maris]